MDREKVIKALEYCVLSDDCRPCEYWMEFDDTGCQIMKDALAILKEQPEIVRCKDCKYGIVETDTQCFCEARVEENGLAYHKPNWFCADGERREET